MKKLFFIGVALVLALSMSAQKQMLTSAWSYLKDGYLDDAKKAIDKAELNPQTAENYKTFWFKGNIYLALSTTKNKKYQALCDNCIDVAYDAYMKALKLNFVKPEHKDIDFTTQMGLMKFVSVLQEGNEAYFESSEALMEILAEKFPEMSRVYKAKGEEAWRANDFETAYNKWSKASGIPSFAGIDTTIYYYTSLAAMRCKKYDEAIEICDMLIKMDYGMDNKERISVYQNLAMALKETGDTVRMLKVLEDGIKKFPNDNYPLVIETFNYYVGSGNSEKAREYINMAMENDPNNAQFLVIRGTLSQEMKDNKAAEADFNKALELDPNNYDAVYGLGALYINTAADTLEWAEKNVPPTDFTTFEKYQEIAKDYQTKALPHLEKALSIKPNDLQVLQILKELYYKTGKYEESQQMGARIKELTE